MPESNIPDLNLVQTSLAVLVHVDVDGEMCVDVSHLIFKTLCDTNNQVVNEGSDGSEGSDILSGAVVELDVDNVLLGVGEVDCQVVQVLGEFAYLLHQNCASFTSYPSQFNTYLVGPQL
jgi:hypothetical protein